MARKKMRVFRRRTDFGVERRRVFMWLKWEGWWFLGDKLLVLVVLGCRRASSSSSPASLGVASSGSERALVTLHLFLCVSLCVVWIVVREVDYRSYSKPMMALIDRPDFGCDKGDVEMQSASKGSQDK